MAKYKFFKSYFYSYIAILFIAFGLFIGYIYFFIDDFNTIPVFVCSIPLVVCIFSTLVASMDRLIRKQVQEGDKPVSEFKSFWMLTFICSYVVGIVYFTLCYIRSSYHIFYVDIKYVTFVLFVASFLLVLLSSLVFYTGVRFWRSNKFMSVLVFFIFIPLFIWTNIYGYKHVDEYLYKCNKESTKESAHLFPEVLYGSRVNDNHFSDTIPSVDIEIDGNFEFENGKMYRAFVCGI